MEQCRILLETPTGNGSISNVSIPCTSWRYDDDLFSETLVTELDLVCDAAILVSVLIAALEASTILASLAYTQLIDRWGRKKAFLINAGTYVVGGVASSFAPGLVSFAFLRVLAEMNALSTFNICYIWAMEMV